MCKRLQTLHPWIKTKSTQAENQAVSPTLIEINWGLSTAKYSSASHSLFTGTPVLHFPDCSGKV